MDLSCFKELNLAVNDVVEYTRMKDYSKNTCPAYYLGLTEKLSEEWTVGRAKTPFIEVGHFKDKNGVVCDVVELPLEEILYLSLIGKSTLI